MFTLTLFAKESYELQLYEKILPAIFNIAPITIYADPETKKILQKSKVFRLVDKCDRSVDLLVGKDFVNVPYACQDKPIFATNYRTLRDNDNSFGAFYWIKGRPQVRFQRNVIKQFDLILPDYLRRYMK